MPYQNERQQKTEQNAQVDILYVIRNKVPVRVITQGEIYNAKAYEQLVSKTGELADGTKLIYKQFSLFNENKRVTKKRKSKLLDDETIVAKLPEIRQIEPKRKLTNKKRKKNQTEESEELMEERKTEVEPQIPNPSELQHLIDKFQPEWTNPSNTNNAVDMTTTTSTTTTYSQNDLNLNSFINDVVKYLEQLSISFNVELTPDTFALYRYIGKSQTEMVLKAWNLSKLFQAWYCGKFICANNETTPQRISDKNLLRNFETALKSHVKVIIDEIWHDNIRLISLIKNLPQDKFNYLLLVVSLMGEKFLNSFIKTINDSARIQSCINSLNATRKSLLPQEERLLGFLSDTSMQSTNQAGLANPSFSIFYYDPSLISAELQAVNAICKQQKKTVSHTTYSTATGWNELSEQFKKDFNELIRNFKSTVEQVSSQEKKQIWNNNENIRNWFKGLVVFDPGNIDRSAIISDYELINHFFTFLAGTMYEINICKEILNESPRLKNILKDLTKWESKNTRAALVNGLAIRSVSTLYLFLSVHDSEEDFFTYLDLVHDAEIIKKAFAKLSGIDKYCQSEICENLQAWLISRNISISDVKVKKPKTAVASKKPQSDIEQLLFGNDDLSLDANSSEQMINELLSEANNTVVTAPSGLHSTAAITSTLLSTSTAQPAVTLAITQPIASDPVQSIIDDLLCDISPNAASTTEQTQDSLTSSLNSPPRP